MNAPAPRLMVVERQWTLDAAASVGADASRLIRHADDRAGTSPVRDLDGRDFGRETREELADARNYLCWWLEQIGRGAHIAPEIASDLVPSVAQTLTLVASAYQHADHAHHLMADWPRSAAA